MYKAFYGLREKPFNLTPDPRFLYLSEKHKEAFAHLLYGIRSRSGFVMVTGEIGTGKTTICRNLLNQLDEDTELAFIFNPMLSPLELLKKIVSEFGIDAKGTNALELTEELNEYLLEAAAKGKNCVLLIDEAQNLDPQVLEQIRLLSNLETETEKLLQIVLIGQPELGEKLALHELRQLNQRITARYHLKPLSEKEVMQYVAYRLHVAGGRRKVKFARAAVRAVYRISKGTPRVINALCDRALLIGFTRETHTITKGIIYRAYREVRGDAVFGRRRRLWTFRQLVYNPVAALAAVCIIIAVYLNSPTLQARTAGALGGLAAFLPDWKDAGPENNRNIAEARGLTPPPGELQHEAQQPAAEGGEAPVPEVDPGAALDTAPLPATPAPAPAAAAAAALDAILARTSIAESDAAAMAALLAAWKKEPAGTLPAALTDATMDAFIRGQAWSFDRLTPALDQLIALDLPVLIKVISGGEARWIALTGAGDSSLTVSVGKDAPATVERSVLLSMFAAEAIVPWNDTAPGAPVLRQGQQGPTIAELKEKLRRLKRLRPENTSEDYDVETASAIARIQAETGLDVDGVAGKQVRMVLSSWLKEDGTPSLAGKTPPPAPTVVAKQTPAAPETADARDEVAKTPAPEAAPENKAEAAQPAAAVKAPETAPPTEKDVAPVEETVAAGDAAAPSVEAPATTEDSAPAEPTPATDAAPAAAEAPTSESTPAEATESAALSGDAKPDANTTEPAASGDTTTPLPDTVTLTNIARDKADDDNAPEAAQSETARPAASGTQLVVVELDDPGSIPATPPENPAATDASSG